MLRLLNNENKPGRLLQAKNDLADSAASPEPSDAKLLLVDEKIVAEALERTLASGDLVRETIGDHDLIFLPHLKRAEEVIAARIKNLTTAGANYPPIDLDKAVDWCQGKTGKELAPSQREALKDRPKRRGHPGRVGGAGLDGRPARLPAWSAGCPRTL